MFKTCYLGTRLGTPAASCHKSGPPLLNERGEFSEFHDQWIVGTHFALFQLRKESPFRVIEIDVLQESDENVVRS